MNDESNICPREEDFYRENEEHLKKRRNKLNKKREELKANKAKESHWMKCPKCGDQMFELELLDIMIEQCEGCDGLFFDSGELETLLDITDRRGFFSSIKRTLYN
ncbi:MAG: hypothetical protein CME70_04410 [Halobacteriovorax sp.]|nr:hypothetical protein [Halobacteriovorax sp.]